MIAKLLCLLLLLAGLLPAQEKDVPIASTPIFYSEQVNHLERGITTVDFNKRLIDFGTLTACSEIGRDSFEMRNNTDFFFAPPARAVIRGFIVEPENDFNIPPGESRIYYVTFTGDLAGSPYDEKWLPRVFLPDGRVLIDTIRLQASLTKQPCLSFLLPHIKGSPGDRVTVPLVIRDIQPNTNFRSAIATVVVTWNPTVLVPEDFPAQAVILSNGKARLTFALPTQNGPVLHLPFVVTLGNIAISSLLIESFAFSESFIEADIENGSMELNGLCTDPVTRLFNPYATIGIRVYGDRVDVTNQSDEATNVTMQCFTLNGNSILRSHLNIIPGGSTTVRIPDNNRAPYLISVLSHGRLIYRALRMD